MKFPSAYYLVLIYITIIFKPLIPVISDVYSHTFGEAIHLSTVHARYGSNHLDKALAKAGDNTKEQRNSSLAKAAMVHINASAYIYIFHADKILPRYFLTTFEKLYTIFLSTFSPPPKK